MFVNPLSKCQLCIIKARLHLWYEHSYKDKNVFLLAGGQVQGTFICQYNCGHISNYTDKTTLVRTTATVIQNFLGQGLAIT